MYDVIYRLIGLKFVISFILLLLTTSILLFLVIKNYKETRVRFKIDVTNNDKGQC